jgi:hypothetical protein
MKEQYKKFIFILISCLCFSIKSLGSTVTGLFNNDTLIDTITYESEPNEKDYSPIKVSLSTSNGINHIHTIEYKVSEGTIIILHEKKGEIIILECGPTGGAPRYYNYFEYNSLVNNWCLVKMITVTSAISGEGYMPPIVEIDYKDGSIGINGETIEISKRSVERSEIRKTRMQKHLIDLNDSLTGLYKGKQIKNIQKSFYNINHIGELMYNIPISNTTLEIYNNLGYYFSFTDTALPTALYILEKIITQFPQRIVAYLNCADAYFNLGEKEKATLLYRKYADLMKKDGKENKIPKRVHERSN